MVILITGGYGFIGSHVVEKLKKEGHEIIIIDNLSTGKKENLIGKYNHYHLSVEDEKCSEVFSNNSIDVVIHLAGVNDNDDEDISKNHMLGLLNLLKIASKNKVNKFINISSTDVYGDCKLNICYEDTVCNPNTTFGTIMLTSEIYCKLYKEKYNIDIISLRLSNVYGPRQSTLNNDLIISKKIYKILNDEIIINDEHLKAKDYIYVNDVVEAIYSTIEFSVSEKLNITSGVLIEENQIVKILKNEEFKEKDYNETNIFPNDLAKSELNWNIIHNIKIGLKETFEWNSKVENNDVKKIIKVKTVSKFKLNLRKILPYIENILVFSIIIICSNFIVFEQINDVIDLKLVYIIMFASLYGLNQSSIAIFLSCGIYIWQSNLDINNLMSGFNNMDLLLHLSLYVFIGAVLGYSVDSNRVEIELKESEIEDTNIKFNFLYDMYNESKDARKNLHEQIRNSHDSFGKIFKATSALDTLQPDGIFAEAVQVIEEIMKSDDVSIYFVSKGEAYLRLISKSKNADKNLKKSIYIEENKEIKMLLKSKKVFVNRELKQNLPIMMVAVSVDNKAKAVIAINSMEFEDLSLYKENLFKIVSELIANSISKAYQYEEAIEDEKYVNSTLWLKYEYFKELVDIKAKDKNENGNEFTLLEINNCYFGNTEKENKIQRAIREWDYMGIGRNKEFLLLLSNTAENEAHYLTDRLDKMGIEVIISNMENVV